MSGLNVASFRLQSRLSSDIKSIAKLADMAALRD